VRTRSLKRQRQIREFIPQAEAFLAENPRCQFPGCTLPSTVVHHSRGRRGWRLLHRPWWKASCAPHNQFAEDETGAALECGWLLRIEGVS
jgi:hypothetical protein